MTIKKEPAKYVCIARDVGETRKLLCDNYDKIRVFPSAEAAKQFMYSECWSEELINSVYFTNVEVE